MKHNAGKWSCRLPIAALLACLFFSGNGMAATPVTIPATQTTIQSTAERMISYRHQNHMWQTADGATHVMVNRGYQSPGNSLQIYSSFDGATGWTGGTKLSNSDRYSTSDGYLVGDILYVTYSTPSGGVVFTALQYDAGTAAWSQVWSETVFSSPGMVAINPAMAADATGTIWLAFVANEIATGNYSIKLLRNTSQLEGWVDTGLVFGDVDNLSIERSARPVPTASGMGMIYSVNEKILWASRDNATPLDQPWTNQVLFVSQAGDTDPYASHFSVASDAQNNIHMAFVDGGRLGYFRFRSATQTWRSTWLSKDIQAGYVQTTVAAGNVVIAVNVNTQLIGVYQSLDGGTNFSYSQRLVHPSPTAGVSYKNPRMETPSNTTGSVPLLQQYVDNGVQRLLFYDIPVL